MKQAATGDTVHVHYTGTLDDGTVFDSSKGREPLEVTIGGGLVIPGFDNALQGMAVGETKSVTLPPEEAYGDHHEQLVHSVERERIPAEVTLELGNMLQAADNSGNEIQLRIVGLDDASVTLDANHPLAGQALTFELSLVQIVG